jgi:hypothetical protein
MYATLIPIIKAKLQAVTAVKSVWCYPEKKIDKFPCVIFRPDALSNGYETTIENAKAYTFQLWVIIGLSGTTADDVFTKYMPKAVDAVVAALDTGWDFGTSGGHRMRAIVSSAGPWQLAEEQDGAVCFAPLTLEVRLSNSI